MMKNDFFINSDGNYIMKCKSHGGIVEVILDKEGFDKINKINTSWWGVRTNKNSKTPYIYGVHNSKKVLLHRYLLDADKVETVDHVNRNKLDNRMDNLRIASVSENNKNRDVYGYSGVKNVHWNKTNRKWVVYISVNGKNRLIGYFDLIDDAEHAAIMARRKTDGYLD